MRLKIIAVLLLLSTIAKSQNIIDWDGQYQLQLSDFKSSATEIGNVAINSIQAASGFNFSFNMSRAEFMFTKNFNAKVNCSFNRNASSLVAADSLTAMDLLSFARFDFDLSELYARKFREKLHAAKGTFSDASFFQPVYNAVQAEYNERHTKAAKETDLGRDKTKLIALHENVLKEIEELSDFCKACKPSKNKK